MHCPQRGKDLLLKYCTSHAVFSLVTFHHGRPLRQHLCHHSKKERKRENHKRNQNNTQPITWSSYISGCCCCSTRVLIYPQGLIRPTLPQGEEEGWSERVKDVPHDQIFIWLESWPCDCLPLPTSWVAVYIHAFSSERHAVFTSILFHRGVQKTASFTTWCSWNQLKLSFSKTNELIVN